MATTTEKLNQTIREAGLACELNSIVRMSIDFEHDLSLYSYDSRDEKPQVRVIWAPNDDALTVTATPPRPAGDPAIIFTVAGHAFLLDFYDTPDEKPIAHLIREFSEGRLPQEPQP